MKQTVRFRVDFTEGCSIGPGKIELLEGIERTGSLRQAAQSLGMSYRRAWLLLDSVNRSFNEAATTSSVGGQGGGGVTLTPFGHEIIRCYRAAARAIESVAWTEFERIGSRALATPKGKGEIRRKRLSRSPQGRDD